MDAKDVDVKREVIQSIMDYEVELGALWSKEFIGALSTQANKTLIDWLKANNAPKQVVDMLEDVILLERCVSGFENQNLSDNLAMQLTQELPSITYHIAELGGVFCGGGSESYRRENVITWQPARPAPPIPPIPPSENIYGKS